MDLNKKYNLKELTKLQQKKADKIVQLMEELKSEGVNTVIIASPTNNINYYRSKNWVDSIEDMEGLCNQTEFVYTPKQDNGLIDHFGF
jgi:pyridoxal/pyridoxine/pyridoxamine kinase